MLSIIGVTASIFVSQKASLCLNTVLLMSAALSRTVFNSHSTVYHVCCPLILELLTSPDLPVSVSVLIDSLTNRWMEGWMGGLMKGWMAG